MLIDVKGWSMGTKTGVSRDGKVQLRRSTGFNPTNALLQFTHTLIIALETYIDEGAEKCHVPFYKTPFVMSISIYFRYNKNAYVNSESIYDGLNLAEPCS